MSLKASILTYNQVVIALPLGPAAFPCRFPTSVRCWKREMKGAVAGNELNEGRSANHNRRRLHSRPRSHRRITELVGRFFQFDKLGQHAILAHEPGDSPPLERDGGDRFVNHNHTFFRESPAGLVDI